jgi:hypothetical protein
MQGDRYHDDRLAAERIVADHRPHHEHAEEQRQHAGHDLRRCDRDRQPPLARMLAERRVQVVGGHNPLSGANRSRIMRRILSRPVYGRFGSRILAFERFQ